MQILNLMMDTNLVSMFGLEQLGNIVNIHAGLDTFWETVRDSWIKPIFLAAIAVFALVFIKDRAWMKLIAFVGIAAVVGVLIFAGGDLFGDPDQGLSGVAKDAAESVDSFETIHLGNLTSK